MLERNDIKALLMDEIRRGQITAKIILCDGPANVGRKSILSARIAHGDDGGLRHIIKMPQGQFKVGGKGRNAATTRQRIADKGNL
jgi:hypothetical protein